MRDETSRSTRRAGDNDAEPCVHDEEDDDDDDEEEDDEEVMLSEQFDGPTDAAGQPHGCGSLTVHFLRGKR